MTVLRDPTGTTIKVNLRGLPADVTSLNVYAIDPNGVATLIGLSRSLTEMAFCRRRLNWISS